MAHYGNKTIEGIVAKMCSDTLIEMKNICKTYHQQMENEVRALDHISLSIRPGEFVAIVGQSGSGKSTLMNCIGCLDMPTQGQYFFCGHDVSKLSDAALSHIRNREIGFIFQGFNLIPSLSALENVELPLSYRGVSKGERRKRAMEALQSVGLSNRMSHRPSQLSGGQQQRVAIARAIAAQPSLLLADEPTGNLDSRSGNEIVKILLQQHRSGRTIVLITHDDRIAQIAGRVIRIHDGTLADDSSCHPE